MHYEFFNRLSNSIWTNISMYNTNNDINSHILTQQNVQEIIQ